MKPYRRLPWTHPHSGAGLLEVLILILVMSLGLLAMGQIHSVILRDGSSASNRAVATSLAQAKLDDLRSFKWLSSTTSGGEGCGAGIFCYSEIVTNAGGSEQANGTLILPAGDRTLGNTAFSLSWTVVTTEDTQTALHKLVNVLVQWTDQNGADQLTLSSVIAADFPSTTALAESGIVTPGGQGARVRYTPKNAPDSIAISIGGNKSTETSKPLPEVTGVNSITVSFPTVVYESPSAQENLLLAQEDFKTVNCTCNLQNGGKGWTPFRSIWNADLGKLQTERGEWIDKPKTGVPDPSTGQSELCTICCRDHHDAGTAYPTYRPYVAAGSTSSGDFDASANHMHYKAGTTPGTAANVAGIGDRYVEACRLKRFDGLWRVVPDWYQIDLVALPCDYFADAPSVACPPTSATSVNNPKLLAYQQRTRDILNEFASYASARSSTAFPANFAPFVQSGSIPKLLNTATSADDVAPSRQLIARGLYADLIFEPKGATNQPRKIDARWAAAIQPTGTTSVSHLANLPFYDANLTLLSQWNPTSTNSGGRVIPGDCSPTSTAITWNPTGSYAVCVTNEAIKTIDDPTNDYYDGFYSRGKLSPKATSGSTIISAFMDRSNNGLTSSASFTADSTNQSLTAEVKAIIPSGELVTLQFDIEFYNLNDSCVVANKQQSALHEQTNVSWTSGSQSGECIPGKQGNNYWYSCTEMPATATSAQVNFDAPVGTSIRLDNNGSTAWSDPYQWNSPSDTALSNLTSPAASVIIRNCPP